MNTQSKVQKAFEEKIKEKPSLLFAINENEKWLLTQALVDKALKATDYRYFDKVFDEFKTKENCIEAFKYASANLKHIPEDIIKEYFTEEMFYEGLKQCKYHYETDEILKYYDIKKLSFEQLSELATTVPTVIAHIDDIELLKKIYSELAPTLEYYEKQPIHGIGCYETDYSPREELEVNIIYHSKPEFLEELKSFIKEKNEEIAIDEKEKSEIIETEKGKMSINVFLSKLFKGESIKLKNNESQTINEQNREDR